MDNKLRERVKEIICEYVFTGIKKDDIHDEIHLLNDLAMDSIKMLEMIAEIEDKFNIMFDDDALDIEVIGVVGNLCNYIEHKMKICI